MLKSYFYCSKNAILGVVSKKGMGYVLTVLERPKRLLTIGAQGRPQLSNIGGGSQEFTFNPSEMFENLLLKGVRTPMTLPHKGARKT